MRTEDTIKVMFPMTSIWIVHRAFSKWAENGGARLGAALSYYALFSIAPLALVAIHLSGAVFGEDAARGEVRKQLNTMMGEEVAEEVENLVKTAAEPRDTFWTPTISLLFLFVAALGAFLHVRGALCTIWKLEPPAGNTWLGMIWDYLLSLIMVFITATMLLVSLAVGVVVPILHRVAVDYVSPDEVYWSWLEIAGSFLFLSLLFASSYRTLSGGRISWGYVVYGSIIAAVLFTIGKTLLGYYIAYSGVATMYGAAGSVVVFLVWVYYSSQILFFGAELIQARRTRHEWLYNEAQG
ncbi:MAG: YihY/virulence factor BrkB family protein [Planctomycetes bacterium]|nr:YihY/virulence factor BrkB family protein [Planctomycetota bacterium]